MSKHSRLSQSEFGNAKGKWAQKKKATMIVHCLLFFFDALCLLSASVQRSMKIRNIPLLWRYFARWSNSKKQCEKMAAKKKKRWTKKRKSLQKTNWFRGNFSEIKDDDDDEWLDWTSIELFPNEKWKKLLLWDRCLLPDTVLTGWTPRAWEDEQKVKVKVEYQW
jgi:hypothetical protein